MLESKLRFSIGKKMLSIFTILITIAVFNSAHATSGEDLFKQNCAACHKLSSKESTGPGMAGVTSRRSDEWLTKWITNSQEFIASGDPDAVAIFEKFKKIQMPSYSHFPEEDIQAIITFLGENDIAQAEIAANPGSEPAEDGSDGDESGVISISKTSVIVFSIIIVLLFFYFRKLNRKVDSLMLDNGFFPAAHSIPNFLAIFFLCVFTGGLIITALSYGLKHNVGQIDGLFFGVFPYLAFGVFILGSIYRYTRKGYKVSSLSSQFLEGKKLFYASQPFHWGLLVLFFGHLIAFLFPRAVIAWNGEPVRLLILEVSSFAFAILALWGLGAFIYRRLTNKKILVVSNKMDMVVYTVLLTQIISGLGVAFFVRWGSTWFASVLTPYLRSIFSFNPDLAAISEAPVLVQIHVISAFLIIGIIPFTRFMHFLVAPVDYIWRKYQLVIWNWNRKAIRRSGRHFFGKRSRNH